jgi:hypothetical protein
MSLGSTLAEALATLSAYDKSVKVREDVDSVEVCVDWSKVKWGRNTITKVEMRPWKGDDDKIAKNATGKSCTYVQSWWSCFRRLLELFGDGMTRGSMAFGWLLMKCVSVVDIGIVGKRKKWRGEREVLVL